MATKAFVPAEHETVQWPTRRPDQVAMPVQTYDAFISYSHSVDGKLAPALQAGLHRFTKPWYRLRALRVFRDETSLSATPELWPSIAQALDGSRWLVLLASPEAAHSKWVNDEVEHWCAAKSTNRIIVVVTSGGDAGGGRVDWQATALPPALRARISTEPRLVDLRWARGVDDLALHNARFRDAIADIAAPIHDRPKDELHGEDVRQHRRTRRLARAAVAGLAALLATSVAAAVVAVDQRETARGQRDAAERQARLALSRQLAAEADAAGDDQLDLALLLAVQARATMSTSEARSSLLRTLLRSPQLVAFVPGTAGATRIAFSPRARVLAVGRTDGGVSLWSGGRGRELRSGRAGGPAVTCLAYSGDGARLAAGLSDGRLVVWDVGTRRPLADRATGTRIDSVALDRTGGIVAWTARSGQTTVATTATSRVLHAFRIPRPFFPPLQAALLGHTLGVGDATRRLTMWDLRSAARSRRFRDVTGPIGPPSVSAYSADMRRFAGVWLGRPGVRTPLVYDLGNPHDRQLAGPDTAIEAMAFTTDVRRLATAAEGRVLLWSIPKGRVQDVTLRGLPGRASAVAFSADGGLVAAAGARGVAVWEPQKVALVRSLKAHGAVAGHVAPILQGTASAAFSPDGRLLAWSMSGPWTGIVVWRLADAREILRFPGARVVGFSPAGDEVAAAVEYYAESAIVVVDVETGERRRVRSLPWSPSGFRAEASNGERPWTADGGKGVGASGALDGTVTLWNTRRRQPIATLRVPGVVERPFFVFDPAGKTLAIATAGGALSLMDMAAESWRSTACRLAGRSFTASEWRLYVGTDSREKRVCSKGE